MIGLHHLQRLFHGTTMAPLELTPTEKTQMLLRTLNAHVLQVLVEQRGLFMEQRRAYFIRTLAENLKEHWVPVGLTAADMETIPLDWMIGMVRSIIDGTGLGGYEERLYAHFSQPVSTANPAAIPTQERESEAVDLPEVSERTGRDRRIPSRRSYPRRGV